MPTLEEKAAAFDLIVQALVSKMWNGTYRWWAVAKAENSKEFRSREETIEDLMKWCRQTVSEKLSLCPSSLKDRTPLPAV